MNAADYTYTVEYDIRLADEAVADGDDLHAYSLWMVIDPDGETADWYDTEEEAKQAASECTDEKRQELQDEAEAEALTEKLVEYVESADLADLRRLAKYLKLEARKIRGRI